MTDQLLANKVIVVIGGTSGIGLAATEAFVAAGASVVALGLENEAAEAARSILKGKAEVICGDARDPATPHHAIQKAHEQYGGFHGLYHVAGGSGRQWGDGPLHEISDTGWDETLLLNLTTVFHSNRAAIQQFLDQETGGAIVNLASVLAYSPAPLHFATHAYATAKAAVVGMTRSAAAYYASSNIRINAIAPGLVDTPMAERAQRNINIMHYISQKQPLDGGRIGVPADVTGAAIYLLSDVSRFVTGQVLSVDGGWSVCEASS